MAWDKFKTAQKFLQHANAIHPEDESGGDAHDRALAFQDVYYDCYMSSFSREDLIKRLDEVIAGKVELPEEKEVNEELYRTTYIEKAGSIRARIESGEFD